MDSATDSVARDLVAALLPVEIVVRPMFGGLCWYLDGKVLGLINDGAVFVKASSRDALLAGLADLSPPTPAQRRAGGCVPGCWTSNPTASAKPYRRSQRYYPARKHGRNVRPNEATSAGTGVRPGSVEQVSTRVGRVRPLAFDAAKDVGEDDCLEEQQVGGGAQEHGLLGKLNLEELLRRGARECSLVPQARRALGLGLDEPSESNGELTTSSTSDPTKAVDTAVTATIPPGSQPKSNARDRLPDPRVWSLAIRITKSCPGITRRGATYSKAPLANGRWNR